jgi:ribosomal protein S18 acetylase RimI-like enzyme
MLCSEKFVTLRNGSRVLMRFLKNGDQTDVIRFFQRVPREDMRYLTNFSANLPQLKFFLCHQNNSQNTPLLALEIDQKRIIGAVFFSRSQGSAKHVGEVYCIFVAQPFQKMGLGNMLLDECIRHIRFNRETMVSPLKAARFPCGSPDNPDTADGQAD